MNEPAAIPMIELQGISKSFEQQNVINNVDLTIGRGEAISIIGPSGTGKSTILRIIAGLLAPDQGLVRVAGQVRQGLIEDQKRVPFRISLVFQQAALFDSLTVGENVGFLLYQHSRLSRHRIRELVSQSLEKVGLHPDTADKYPSQLSGGMRKRVSIARAIMEDPEDDHDDPELILYDEPTAGLDPVASTLIEDLMRNLKEKVQCCATYVVVTHQDSTIRRASDRVVMLYQGQVQWQGLTSQIDQTDNAYVRQFFEGNSQGPMQGLQ
ncbi:MAG: ABC transporter ATP-binding protein [Prochlorotrichaceae cyanobacterium]